MTLEHCSCVAAAAALLKLGNSLTACCSLKGAVDVTGIFTRAATAVFPNSLSARSQGLDEMSGCEGSTKDPTLDKGSGVINLSLAPGG